MRPLVALLLLAAPFIASAKDVPGVRWPASVVAANFDRCMELSGGDENRCDCMIEQLQRRGQDHTKQATRKMAAAVRNACPAAKATKSPAAEKPLNEEAL